MEGQKEKPLIRCLYRHDVTKGGDFIMGVYGEISHFLSDQADILFLVIYIKKNVDTHHESFS